MKNVAFISVLLFSFISCQRDEEIINDNPFPPSAAPAYTIDDFTKLDTGNYWVYQHFTIDTTGPGETAWPGYDSCYYTGDTILGSYLYKKAFFYWLFPLESFLRDSSGYLVNGNGNSLLTTAIQNDTFYVYNTPGGGTIYYTVTSLLSPITVPAGTFADVLDVTAYAYYSPPISGLPNPVISHTYYAKDIGKIMEQYRASGELFQHPNSFRERRLIGYHVN